jgi:hypothetical protein
MNVSSRLLKTHGISKVRAECTSYRIDAESEMMLGKHAEGKGETKRRGRNINKQIGGDLENRFETVFVFVMPSRCDVQMKAFVQTIGNERRRT